MAALGVFIGSLLFGLMFASDPHLAAPFSLDGFLLVAASIASGPVVAWILVGHHTSAVRNVTDIWFPLLLTILSVGPLVLAGFAKKAGWRRAWLVVGSLIWLIAGIAFTGAMLT